MLKKARNTPNSKGDITVYLGEHGSSELKEILLNGKDLPEFENENVAMKKYLE